MGGIAPYPEPFRPMEGEEGTDGLGIGMADIDGDNRQTLSFQGGFQGRQRRQLAHTGRTPGGPEIDEQIVPPEAIEHAQPSLAIGDRNIRRRAGMAEQLQTGQRRRRTSERVDRSRQDHI